MSMTTLERPEVMVQQWRNCADAANPAGPLYIAGEFAEADITLAGSALISSISECTGSHHTECCA